MKTQFGACKYLLHPGSGMDRSDEPREILPAPHAERDRFQRDSDFGHLPETRSDIEF